MAISARDDVRFAGESTFQAKLVKLDLRAMLLARRGAVLVGTAVVLLSTLAHLLSLALYDTGGSVASRGPSMANAETEQLIRAAMAAAKRLQKRHSEEARP